MDLPSNFILHQKASHCDSYQPRPSHGPCEPICVLLSHRQHCHHLGDCWGASGLHHNVAKSESNFNQIPRRFIYTLNFEKQWLRHLECLLIGLQLLLLLPVYKSVLHLHGRQNSGMPSCPPANSHSQLQVLYDLFHSKVGRL